MTTSCPCGSQKKFSDCCKPFLTGQAEASKPELLMRSRYTAFTLKNWNYLVQTTDPQSQAEFSRTDSNQWMNSVEFTKLEVIFFTECGDAGEVEFRAHFRQGNKAHIHHEKSKFKKIAKKWYYCLN